MARATLLVLCLLLAAPPPAIARREAQAVAAELDGDYINLLSEEELASRPDDPPPAPAPVAPTLASPAPPPVARARPRRRRRGPSYRQERVAGETYRQKYASWSCSAASLTIALDLLRQKPANQSTEELVIRKLGANISKKDGLTGRGMDALAEVASDFAAQARRVSSPEDVTKAVQAGQLVVLNVRRPSGSGHYVVVSGRGSKDGTLHVKDPAPDGGDFEWDRNTLKSAIRAGGVAVWKQN